MTPLFDRLKEHRCGISVVYVEDGEMVNVCPRCLRQSYWLFNSVYIRSKDRTEANPGELGFTITCADCGRRYVMMRTDGQEGQYDAV